MYLLAIISGVMKLITALFTAVAFGNFSALQCVQEADGLEPSGITAPTVVTHTEIPNTPHMTSAISHQVTL